MVSSRRQLVLVVPDLLWGNPGPFHPAANLRLPALERLLARAQSPSQSADIVEGNPGHYGLLTTLFQLFQVQLNSGELPVAAVTYGLDSGDSQPGWWMRADPVHLRADIDRLRIFDQRLLGLTPGEAHRLVAELAPLYQASGARLVAFHPERWYLHLPTPPRLGTSPLPAIHGRDVRPYLPTGPDGRIWQIRLNEGQMQLHTSAVNVERERRGLLTVNSLWFWGEGYTPTLPTSPFSQVWSHHPLARGLGRLSGTPTQGCPVDGEDWLTRGDSSGCHLVVLDNLLDLPEIGEYESWANNLVKLEQSWFDPLLTALGRQGFSKITLHPCPSPARYLTTTRLYHWWRRQRPLLHYLAQSYPER